MSAIVSKDKSLFVTLLFMIYACGVASAQPPPIPADYSGYITINGEAAPEGTTVFAKIGDYNSTAVTVGSDGRYEYLIVMPPDTTYVGETIEFYVDPDSLGPTPATAAAETDTYEQGTSDDPFNLTVVIIDETPPLIMNIQATGVSTSGATITWITDEPATSQVEYGETAAYGSLTALDSGLVTSHSVGLSGLAEDTTYHFRVISTDEADNTALSSDQTFKTSKSSPPPSPPPIIIPPANEPPVADAGPDRTAYVNVTLHLGGEGSHDPDGDIVEYHWFPEGGVYESGPRIMHAYSEPGNYTAILVVTDDDGATGTDNCTVAVLPLPAPPEAEIFETVPANESGFVDASFWVDTTVTVNTTDIVTVTVIKYESNPHPEDPMPEAGVPKYADVFVSDPGAVDWPIYVEMSYTDEEIEGLDEGSLGMYYWADGAWRRCSDTGIDAVRKVVWAYMTEEEASGSPILIGGALIPLLPAEYRLSNFTVEPVEVEFGEGVNVSVTATNVGEEPGNCTVNLDVGDGLVVSEKTVLLPGGESETLVFAVLLEAEGTHLVEIDGLNGSFVVKPAPVPAEFVVSDLEVSPGEVSTGEDVTASVTVSNIGELEGVHALVLEVDGETIESVDVTLEGGGSTVVEFAVSRAAPGVHNVGVEGLAGAFRVLRPAEFEFSDFSVSPSEVEEGGEVEVSVEVANTGEEEGSIVVELGLDGSVAETETVTLSGGAAETVSFTVTEGVGAHTVDIGGLTGSFTVSEPASPLGGSTMTIVIVGALAILAIVVMARKFRG